jgi:hypothetical protein
MREIVATFEKMQRMGEAGSSLLRSSEGRSADYRWILSCSFMDIDGTTAAQQFLEMFASAGLRSGFHKAS